MTTDLTLNQLQVDTEADMQKALEVFQSKMAKLRTGRATTGILDSLRVKAPHGETPLAHLATISVADSRSLTVTPWDKSLVSTIENAIRNAGLGFNPVTTGTLIRVPMPPLTEARRREFVKLVVDEAEQSCISIRHHRRTANTQVDSLFKSKSISEDQKKSVLEAIQQLTDQMIEKIKQLASAKEKQLMEV